MLDFDYNWTEQQMRDWLNTPEPDWDRAFTDAPRKLAILGYCDEAEKRRLGPLIDAYWAGKIDTRAFLGAVEGNLSVADFNLPAEPQPSMDSFLKANRGRAVAMRRGDYAPARMRADQYPPLPARAPADDSVYVYRRYNGTPGYVAVTDVAHTLETAGGTIFHLNNGQVIHARNTYGVYTREAAQRLTLGF